MSRRHAVCSEPPCGTGSSSRGPGQQVSGNGPAVCMQGCLTPSPCPFPLLCCGKDTGLFVLLAPPPPLFTREEPVETERWPCRAEVGGLQEDRRLGERTSTFLRLCIFCEVRGRDRLLRGTEGGHEDSRGLLWGAGPWGSQRCGETTRLCWLSQTRGGVWECPFVTLHG